MNAKDIEALRDEPLLPCPVPWCCSDVLEVLRSPWSHNMFVKCQNCGATGPAVINQAEACATWNTRPQSARLTAHADAAERGPSRDELLAGLRALVPRKLCGELWNLPDAETVRIVVTFGSLKAARAILARAQGDA